MRKILTILLFTCNFWVGFAQEPSANISFVFQNTTREEVLLELEKKTSYMFYFVSEWLSDGLISGNFIEIPIEDILDYLFKGTFINYYISENHKVILTQNNSIYDALPIGFFGSQQNETEKLNVEKDVSAPVFYKEATTNQPKQIETIRIGREDRNSTRTQFTLRGVIKNELDGSPISDLALLVKGSNIGSVTDVHGNFELSLSPGLNVIETRSLGFEDVQKRIIIYNDGLFNFSLKESYEGLDEVVIDATANQNVENTQVGAAKIDVGEIKNIPMVLGERDIFKVATTLPGISTTGEGAAGFHVRGGKTDQNLILLDGATLYNPAHFFGIFSAVNPFSTREVTIHKGNIPAKFGGRLSSVFDIRSKDANLEKITGQVSIGPVTSSVVLEAPLVKEQSGVLIGGRSTYSNWILRSLDEKQLQKSNASFYDLIAKYNQKMDNRNSMSAMGYYSSDAFSITSDSLYSYNNFLASVNWHHTFDDRNNGDVSIANSNYQFNIDFDGAEATNFKIGYAINETELKLNMNYNHSKNHKFNYGISSKLYEVQPGSIEPITNSSQVVLLQIPKERALESAVYIADNYSINEKFALDMGVRYSVYVALGKSMQRIYQEGLPKSDANLLAVSEYKVNEVIETYSNPELRFGARYLLGSKFSIKASYNTTHQYIHTLSNNTTVSPTDTWKLSDVNIKPQDAQQYSLGLFKNFDDNIFELSLEGYYKKNKNLLDYKVGAQLLLNETLEQDVLQGEGKSYGIEFLVKKTNGRLNGWLAYSYSRSFVKLESEFPEEQVNNGDFFPSNYDKPHDVSVVANYKLTKRFSFSANFVYQTGRPVTVPVGNYILNGAEYVLYSDRNKYRIPDYYRLDISFNVEGNHKIKKFAHSFWNISIYNVLGRNNPYSVFFVTEEGEIKAYQSSIFSIPIPTITYNFKF